MKLFALISILILSHTALAQQDFEFAVSDSLPPFVVVGEKKITGPLPDIARAVCKKIKAECVLTVYPSRRGLTEVESGNIDGIFPLLKTKEREATFYFSDEVVKTSFSLYAQKNHVLNYKNPKDLEDHTVVVYGPSGAQSYTDSLLTGVKGSSVVVVRNNIVLLKMLSQNRFNDKSVGILNSDVAASLIDIEKIINLRRVAVLKKISYSFAFSRKKVSADKFRKFNKGLKELMADGTIKKILTEYKMQSPD